MLLGGHREAIADAVYPHRQIAPIPSLRLSSSMSSRIQAVPLRGRQVLVSVFWKELAGSYQCASKGVWEAEAENEIKGKAESGRPILGG